MVGRDVLLGGLLGVAHAGAIVFGWLIPKWAGYPVAPPLLASPLTLGGVRGQRVFGGTLLNDNA